MHVSCPHCGVQVEHEERTSGHVVACPSCRGQFQMPQYVVPVAQPVMAAPALVAPSEASISVPLLISAIANIAVGMLWASTCIGLILAIPLFILSGFEFSLYAKIGRRPLPEIARTAHTLAIFEIICGLFNTPTLVCGIILMINAGKVQ